MDQARSRRPVSSTRPVRRSLVEFALPASGALVRMPTVAPPVPVAEITNNRVNEDKETAALSLRPTSRKRVGKAAPASARLADEYQAKVFDLMVTNAFAALNYAQRLISAKTPSEFVALSTSQACKQWDLIIKQAGELGSIAQRLAASDVKRPIVVEWK
jgi:hypothetical protein